MFVGPVPPDAQQEDRKEGVAGEGKGDSCDLGDKSGRIDGNHQDQKRQDQERAFGNQEQVALVSLGINQPKIDVVGNCPGARNQKPGDGADGRKDAANGEGTDQNFIEAD